MTQDSPALIEVLCIDIQGQFRSKFIPASQHDKLTAGKVRLPLSTQLLDVWGDDIDHVTGMGLSRGDPDGAVIPEMSTLSSSPWHGTHQHVLCSLHGLDARTGGVGPASFADSRAQLNQVQARCKLMGYTPVVAVELEFYLLDPASRTAGRPVVPEALTFGGDSVDLQLYEPRATDALSAVLDCIREYAIELELPTDTLIAEFGPGQFEMNLLHTPDALTAADNATLFKRVVDRAAVSHDLIATFMAKPYTEHPGSGMHVHLSLIDEQGQNVFGLEGPKHQSDWPGNPALQAATAGLLDTLPDTLAIFAPNSNSFRRLQPESFAPVRLDWGHDHRGVAIRLPETTGPAARLEHRVAGADANPYLVVAAVLAGVLHGLERGTPPGWAPQYAGSESRGPRLEHDWYDAIECMRESAFIADWFGADFQDQYTRIKKHEAMEFKRRVTDVEHDTFLCRF